MSQIHSLLWTRKMVVSLLAAILALGMLASRSFAQSGEKDQPAGGMTGMPDMSKMSPEEQAQMKAWMEYMTPGPAHESMIKTFAGTWDATITMYEPGKPPQSSTGTMKSEPILGNRYLHQLFKGTFMGMPYEGAGTMGYDNAIRKYTGTWMDSMGTGTMYMTGGYNEAKKEYTLTGEMPDMTKPGAPMCTIREVIAVADADHHTMEMYGPGPDGKEMKMMEIKYTRAK